MATSPFHLKGNGNGHEMTTPPFSKGRRWWEGDLVSLSKGERILYILYILSLLRRLYNITAIYTEYCIYCKKKCVYVYIYDTLTVYTMYTVVMGRLHLHSR